MYFAYFGINFTDFSGENVADPEKDFKDIPIRHIDYMFKTVLIAVVGGEAYNDTDQGEAMRILWGTEKKRKGESCACAVVRLLNTKYSMDDVEDLVKDLGAGPTHTLAGNSQCF